MRRALLAAFRGGGLALAFALQAAWLLQPLPPFLKILPASLFVLSIARPAAGLLVLAGIGPMANALSLWSHSPLPGIRLLEQLVLAFVSGAGLRWWRGGTELRLAEAAALSAASAAASCIAVQPALLIQRMPEMTPPDHLRALLQNGDYFLRSGLWDPLFFAALTIEWLALAVTTERIVRLHAGAAEGTIRMTLFGHAGVAALNLQQLVSAGMKAGDLWRELLRLLRDVRVSLFYDVNAAGSVFLLNLLGGVGLLRKATRFQWEIALALVLIGLGLWVAGSRVALLAFAVTLVVVLSLAVWNRRGRTRWLAAAAIAVMLAAGGLAAMLYPAARNVSVATAAAPRRIMAQTSVNMWRAAPVFGIGIGRFYEESSRFGAEALLRELGIGTTSENAHNYFLQVLGTEGIVGLGALLLLLGVVIVPAIRAERAAPMPLRRWLLAGVAGYLLTWLTGHPQLVPEAAFAFALVIGVLAGLSVAPDTTLRASSGSRRSGPREGGPGRTAWRGPVMLGAVLLLATGPFRSAQTIRQADLEHLGIGLSKWQPELDGIRYRLAGRSFAVYLPADGTSVDLPLRRAPGAPDPLIVTISAGGRTLYEPFVSGETWQQIRVQLPRTNRRFARVDVEVRSAQSPGGPLPSPALYVGKAERR
ncbi:MAG TPA: O-antigen ligase family protein [Vicinamibacterales bacterium]